MTTIGIIILAAGKGTRMKVDTPKALSMCLGKSLLDYVTEAAISFANSSELQAEIGVVVGHRKELLEEWWNHHELKDTIKLAWQKTQNGTADAVKACFNDLPQFWNYEYTLVACADTPLITQNEFNELFKQFRLHPELVGVAATFEAQNPTGYGRIVKSEKGFHIVEEKDADQKQKSITEVNSGFYILKTSHVKEVLGKIDNKNKSGEFYLTDLFQDNYSVKPIKFESEKPFLGINTLEQLAQVEAILLETKLRDLMLSGVRLIQPKNIHIDQDVKIEAGTTIYPFTTILGKTSIGANVVIESGCFIQNTKIENDAEILANTCLEQAIIHSRAHVGPMARLRPGSIIGPEAKIGNFVEVKKANLAKGAKVSHLSYIGDAEIGENTNIGCGFITCNYDGVNKHKTKIGSNSFIGSDCQAIAPIEIGNDAFIAAGSTISKNVPDGAFAIARGQQTTKEGAAKRFLKTKKP